MDVMESVEYALRSIWGSLEIKDPLVEDVMKKIRALEYSAEAGQQKELWRGHDEWINEDRTIEEIFRETEKKKKIGNRINVVILLGMEV